MTVKQHTIMNMSQNDAQTPASLSAHANQQTSTATNSQIVDDKESNPFYLIPWDQDFFEQLDAITCNLLQKQGKASNNKQDIVLVFPHARPQRYVESRHKKMAHETQTPFILPQIMSGNEFMMSCLRHFEKSKPVLYSDLDRMALLHESLMRVAAKSSTILRRFVGVKDASRNLTNSANLTNSENPDAIGESNHFGMEFSWLASLDGLFEECFTQCIEPQDIMHAESEVEIFGAALLSELRAIHSEYLELLHEHGATSPAYDLYRAAQYVQNSRNTPNSQAIPPMFQNKVIIFAGFVRLNEVENHIFRYFWEQGAYICLHSDPLLAGGGKPHYSAIDHEEWMTNWHTHCRLWCEPTGKKALIHFFAGYDVHSQVDKLKKDLSDCGFTGIDDAIDSDDDVAIVLPQPDLLMPVLHELPKKDINISIGYPVTRTLLGGFIELLLTIQEHAERNASFIAKHKNQDTWYFNWRHLLNLLRHPYVRMLSPHGTPNTSASPSDTAIANNMTEGIFQNSVQEKSWRQLMYHMEKMLEKGTPLVDIHTFLDDALGDLEAINITEKMDTFATEFFHVMIINFVEINSLSTLAEALESVTDFLLTYGNNLWQQFPLDAEGLVRCVQSVIPSLRNTLLSTESLSQTLLFRVFREQFRGERIPFEADPLTGMQVLGMLESRLLRFRHVFLMDLTESNTPGSSNQDPLMPDSLRMVLSLPDSHRREILSAHTFYRLLAGAEHAYLYWQEGSSEMTKNIRSRFVEELLWQEEKKQGKILTHGESPLFAATCQPIAPAKRIRKTIPVTAEVQEQIQKFLKKRFSSTALDMYISCPVKFFYTYIMGLKKMETVHEGDHAGEFGNWLHTFLYDIYTPFVNKIFVHNEKSKAAALQLFKERTPQTENFVSPESYFMLEYAGAYHLTNYFDEAPSHIIPQGLEVEYEYTLPQNFLRPNNLGIEQVKLFGRFDRVDLRSNAWEHYEHGHNVTKEILTSEQVEHIIVDYKSGKKKKMLNALWGQDELWEKITSINENPTWQEEINYFTILEEVARYAPSVQLPYYLYVYAQNNPHARCNASWIFMAEKEKEVFLKNTKTKKTDTVDNNEAWQELSYINAYYMPELIKFCLNHLTHTNRFEPCESNACVHCPHEVYC